MEKNILYFILVLLVHAKFSFAQSELQNNNEINNGDSIIYYFQLCQKAKGVDTLVFHKAIDIVQQIEISSNVIEQIEDISKSFRQQNKSWFANKIDQALISNITRTDSFDLAIHYCKKIINNYDASRNQDVRITALNALLELRIPLRNKNIPEAFHYYTSRLRVYLARGDSAAISISYFCLGTIYRITGFTDMTIYNTKKSLSYINKNDSLAKDPISGLYGWMNHTSVLGQLYLEIEDYQTALAYSLEARDIKINKLKEKNVSYLNGNIAISKLMLNDLDSIDVLLNASIQLANEDQDYPSLARTYEIKGQYFLALNQADSAEASLLKCKEVMRVHDVKHFSSAGSHTPNYHLAKVRILQNRLNDARAFLEEEILEIINIRLQVLKEQKLLIEVYNKLGDSKAADSAFKKYSELQVVMDSEERKNRSISFEVESKIEEAENTINVLVTEKKIAELTKKYLIGIAALLLIVAAIIFNRFRVTRKQKVIIEKEKQRSEELLLNILPSEVAEELKAKGSADAKYFNEVTVMFTDFKGFTQISEKLTPSELVAEIDTCFKAFDNIISKHNIEKIKTIGDAYMCAGGLPVANTTNATDVVNAALEIQKFMQEHLQLRKKECKEIFEIRIGIHTGPVVAGIVGVRKFAYDIWGDTVNIASRMESSGEAGKINISGSTYEFVRDKFNCTHRGKIQAKGKGVIDMYFVEGRI